ncbi:response regulator [Frateuria aurantia]
MSPARILVVEDEPRIAELLGEYLRAEGYQVLFAGDGELGLRLAREQRPDLILLDLMLPKIDGLELCRILRQEEPLLGVIMLTARVQEIDRLLGLGLGADDYICKPFSPREVVARVKALLRRSQLHNGTESTVDTGPFQIDVQAQRISLDGQGLALTQSEFRLLRELVGHPGRVYSRDRLLDVMHEDLREVGDRAVDSHIRNLRRKIEDIRPKMACIHAVYGSGYRYEWPAPGA